MNREKSLTQKPSILRKRHISNTNNVFFRLSTTTIKFYFLLLRNFHVHLKIALLKFRKACRKIIIVIRSISSAKDVAANRPDGNRDVRRSQKFSSNDGLTFDLSYFLKAKDVLRIYFFLKAYLRLNLLYYLCFLQVKISDEARHILKQIPPERRSEENINLVCQILVDAVPEFQDFPAYIQKSIVKRADFQEFEPGRVIIRQNHRAYNYYFILSGIG